MTTENSNYKISLSRKYKGVNVALWETTRINETTKENDKFHTVSMNAYYKDIADGTWKNTNYIKIDEVPKLIQLLQSIYADYVNSHITEKRELNDRK